MFVSIVDERITAVHAFIDENERSVSVKGSCYLQLLQDTVGASSKICRNKKECW